MLIVIILNTKYTQKQFSHDMKDYLPLEKPLKYNLLYHLEAKYIVH